MSACPALHELEDIAAGRNGSEPAHSHVEMCASCRAVIEEIRFNNQLLAELSHGLAEPDQPRGAPRSVAPRIEGYELIELIGQGAQGVVYKAVQRTTKRVVAIKFLLGGFFANERRRGRFDREVELAAALRHPNIVTVFDSGTTSEGRHFCAMEFVNGAPLDQFCAGRKLSVRDTMLLFAKICSAVEYAHQRGIIHRDLKPANILIDASDEPRIVDFGLAKVTYSGAPSMTQTGEFAGTFAYAAPEQTLGNPELIDTRTDVYALGVIFYEMLTGELPYAASGALADVLRAIAASNPRPPSTLRADIDGEVETILLQALSKEPERRYQSAGQLARDVEHYLAGEPIDAKRDSAWYMLSKTVRQHRFAFALAATSVIVLAILAVAMSVAYRRASVAEATSAARSEQLTKLLSISNIERGRAMAEAGNTAAAESLLWHEYFAEMSDSSRDTSLSPARWALRELYARQPCRRTVAMPITELATAALGAEGRTVAVVDRSSRDVQVWDTQSNQRITTRSCAGVPTWLIMSSDDKWLACGCVDGAVFLWNLQDPSFERIARIHTSRVQYLAFSRDGSLLASADDSGNMNLFSTPGLDHRLKLNGHTATIRSLAFSSDGRILVSSANDRSVRFWKTDSGECTVSPITSQRRPVMHLACSLDGRQLASVGDDIGIWDSDTLHQRRSLPSPTSAVTSMVLSPDGLLLALGGADRNIQLWNVADGTLMHVLAGHTGPVTWLRFAGDSKTLVSMSTEDCTLRFWDIASASSSRTLSGHVDTVQSACYSADGATLATASGDQTVLLWDVASGTVRSRFSCDSLIYSVALSCDGVLAAAQNDGSIALWDTRGGMRLETLRGHTSTVNSVAFSPDGSLLGSTSQDATLRLWDTRSKTCLRTLADSREPLSRVAFSPDGTFVAAGGKNSAELVSTGDKQRNLVRVWEASSGRLVFSLAGHRAPVRTVWFAPGGKMLASGSDDQTVRLWDMANGRCDATLEGHRYGVYGLSFRADGRLLASGCGGGDIKLWDVANRRCLSTLSSDTATVFGVHLSPDGRTLTSWGANRLVRIWDLAFHDPYITENEAFWRRADRRSVHR